MNISKIKTALPMGIAGTTLAVMVAFGGGQPALSRAMEATTWFDRPAASLSTAAVAYEPGTLLEGRNHFVYYVTQSGARQPIYDHDTLAAFGLLDKKILTVKSDILESIPVTDPLTRLVEDEDGNAAGGRFWLTGLFSAVTSVDR